MANDKKKGSGGGQPVKKSDKGTGDQNAGRERKPLEDVSRRAMPDKKTTNK